MSQNTIRTEEMPKALVEYRNKLRTIAIISFFAVIFFAILLKAWQILFFFALPGFLEYKSLMTERYWHTGDIIEVIVSCQKVTNSLGSQRTVVTFSGKEKYQFALTRRRKLYNNTIIEGALYRIYFNKEYPSELLAYEQVSE